MWRDYANMTMEPGGARRSLYTMATQHRHTKDAAVSQSIVKWGNSLAFRFPSVIARQMHIVEGAAVAYHIDGRRLVIEKADEMPAFSHYDLLKGLRKASKKPVNPGAPRGKEIL
jgi:antitoxin component of MazEF toxin-antitoxin module